MDLFSCFYFHAGNVAVFVEISREKSPGWLEVESRG
jgi:hypothetical protein